MTDLKTTYKWPVGQKSDEEYLADIGKMFSKQDQPITKMPADHRVCKGSGFYGKRRVHVYVGRWNGFYYVVRVFKEAVLKKKKVRNNSQLLITSTASLLEEFGEQDTYWKTKINDVVERNNARWYALGVPRVDKEIEAAFRLASGGWLLIFKSYYMGSSAAVLWVKGGHVVEEVPYASVPPEVACSTSEYGDLPCTMVTDL